MVDMVKSAKTKPNNKHKKHTQKCGNTLDKLYILYVPWSQLPSCGKVSLKNIGETTQ